MTIEQQHPVDHALAVIGLDLAQFERDVTEHLATLPAPLVPGTLYDIEQMFRTLQRIRAVVEAKAAAVWDEAVPLGGAWNGPDGEAYEFDGTHSRKVSDVDGMMREMLRVYMERHPDDSTAAAKSEHARIMAAFPIKREVKLTPINELADLDVEYANVRAEFCTWHTGPKHLQKIVSTADRRGKR